MAGVPVPGAPPHCGPVPSSPLRAARSRLLSWAGMLGLVAQPHFSVTRVLSFCPFSGSCVRSGVPVKLQGLRGGNVKHPS